MIDQIRNVVRDLHAEKFRSANTLLLAGSVVRGEGTATSDLDIVVLYDELPNAYRESFQYQGWPVEAFVHDMASLRYFIEIVDAPTGIPSLASMVVQGIEIPKTSSLSKTAKAFAEKSLAAGPSLWQGRALDQSRYEISDLLEDMAEPRSISELYAAAARLYEKLANHYLRALGQWSAKGKTIPRRLRQVSPEFADRFEAAFSTLFAEADAGSVITLADEVLEAHGGRLFAGYTLDAPVEWKLPDA